MSTPTSAWRKYTGYFSFFYGYLGSRVWISLVATMFVALLDGVGLTMFLPLMQAVDGGNMAASAEQMGWMGKVLDGLAVVGIDMTLVNILLVMLGFFWLKGIAKYLASFYQVILQQRFTNKLRLQLMNLLSGYDYSAFMLADSGRIQNSFSAEVNRVTNAYKQYFLMIQGIIMLLVYVGLACLANPTFAILVGVGGILSNVVFSRIYKKTKRASRKLTQEMHRFQGFLIQSVASFKYLKATSLIFNYKEKVDRSVTEIEEHQREVGKMSALSASLREPMVMLIVVGTILLQVLVFEQSLSAMILSLLFLYRGLNSLNSAQNSYNSFLAVSGSMDNMERFLEELQSRQEYVGEQRLERISGDIHIKDLSYSYDAAKPLLRDVTLTIRENETVGIVGGSGVGKTTLVNIICGLLKVNRGEMTISGVDSNDLNAQHYRTRIGYVTQEAQIFSDTIFNNVSFWGGKEGADEARVWQALKNAHADDFVRNLPDQLQTVVGINGINLSGGQRQRISIARELYRSIDLLIMDEATSALDSQSEHLIQENIDELSGEYTMLVIAHRLSTIKKADKIIHLKPDGSYEIGTFAELQRESDLFREMVSLQSFG